jgi:hypothetical protein
MEEVSKNDVLKVLQNCTVDGSRIVLPSEPMDGVMYDAMKKLFKENGASPVRGKKGTFEFEVGSVGAQSTLEVLIDQYSEAGDENLHAHEEQEEEQPKEKKLLPKKEKRTLKYEFTEHEKHDLSSQLAQACKKLQAIEDEKSSVTSQYTARIKEVRASLNKISELVANGFEYRDTETEVMYHSPSQFMKTIKRLDTDYVWTEKMDPWEHNLFNQPEEEEEELVEEEA